MARMYALNASLTDRAAFIDDAKRHFEEVLKATPVESVRDEYVRETLISEYLEHTPTDDAETAKVFAEYAYNEIANTIAPQNDVIEIPKILCANTYFWTPARTSAQRRTNELRAAREVQAFIDKVRSILEQHNMTIEFSYYESANHVYKRVVVRRNGRKSNITALRNVLKRYYREVR